MQRRLFLLASILGLHLSTFAASNTLSREEVADGWLLLFDGDTTFGWKPRGGTEWAVKDGALCYQPGSGGGYLATTTEFANYQLHVEFWIDDKANSGVFLRCPASGDITS